LPRLTVVRPTSSLFTSLFARAIMSPPAKVPSSSGRVVMGGLVLAAVAAVMTSSIYPVMIAPPEDRRAKASSGTGFRRSGMWESVDREAKS